MASQFVGLARPRERSGLHKAPCYRPPGLGTSSHLRDQLQIGTKNGIAGRAVRLCLLHRRRPARRVPKRRTTTQPTERRMQGSVIDSTGRRYRARIHAEQVVQALLAWPGICHLSPHLSLLMANRIPCLENAVGTPMMNRLFPQMRSQFPRARATNAERATLIAITWPDCLRLGLGNMQE